MKHMQHLPSITQKQQWTTKCHVNVYKKVTQDIHQNHYRQDSRLGTEQWNTTGGFKLV